MTGELGRRALLTGALGAGITAAVAACSADRAGTAAGNATSASARSSSSSPTPSPTPATPAEMAARATVPVLCYHQVRPWEGKDSAYTRQFLVSPPEVYRAQLDTVVGAGYTTITPAQYREHLTTGTALPDRPVMITFDDGKDNQVDPALAEITARDLTATWFIMTVVIGNSGWTSTEQIRAAADAGITIGCHTWDHHDVRTYTDADFATQVVEARSTLQNASGQPVDTFAFPYGAWNPQALPHLAAAGFTTAFQLNDKPLDPQWPQLTLRRVMVDSAWDRDALLAVLDGGP